MEPTFHDVPYDDEYTADELPPASRAAWTALGTVEQTRPTALRFVRALLVTTVIAMALGIIGDAAFLAREWPTDWTAWWRGSAFGAFIRLAPELASSLLYAQQRWGLESLRLQAPGEALPEVIGDGRGRV